MLIYSPLPVNNGLYFQELRSKTTRNDQFTKVYGLQLFHISYALAVLNRSNNDVIYNNDVIAYIMNNDRP
jgi:hypothetical protein